MSYQIPEHVHFRELSGEVVILDDATDAYFGLNASASIVWLALARGEGAEEAARAVSRHFDVGVEQARQDAVELVAELVRRGLLRPPPSEGTP
jgi:hypothetical protein